MHSLSQIAKLKGLKVQDLIDNHLIELTRNLVTKFDERLYFRGMGGELMRQACCDFIEKCSLSHLPFHNDQVIGELL